MRSLCTPHSPYTLQWLAHVATQKCPFCRVSALHLIHGSLDPHESATHMASQLVHPFCTPHPCAQYTDRHTDHATCNSVSTGHIHAQRAGDVA